MVDAIKIKCEECKEVMYFQPPKGKLEPWGFSYKCPTAGCENIKSFEFN